MFFAEPGKLASFVQSAKGAEWNSAFEEIHWLQTANLDGVEPFGFTDGISQPQIDWERRKDVTAHATRLQQHRRARRISARLS